MPEEFDWNELDNNTPQKNNYYGDNTYYKNIKNKKPKSYLLEFVYTVLVSTFVLLFAARVIDGFEIDSIRSAFILSIFISFINTFIKPVIYILVISMFVFALSITPFLILFVFIFIIPAINAFFLMLSSSFVTGVGVVGFSSAFFAAITISFFTFFVNRLIDYIRM